MTTSLRHAVLDLAPTGNNLLRAIDTMNGMWGVSTFLGEANWPGSLTTLGLKADTRLLSPVSLALSTDGKTLFIGQADGSSTAFVVKYDMTVNYTSMFVGNGARVSGSVLAQVLLTLHSQGLGAALPLQVHVNHGWLGMALMHMEESAATRFPLQSTGDPCLDDKKAYLNFSLIPFLHTPTW
jgi:hypothetical protein